MKRGSDRKILNLVLKIDKIIDFNPDFTKASKKILDLLIKELNARSGSIAFFNPQIKKLEFLAKRGSINYLLSWKCFEKKKEVLGKYYVAVPIVFKKEIIGVISLIGRVNDDSKKILQVVQEFLNGRFKAERDSQGFKRMFQKYVGEKTLEKILKNYHKEYIDGERNLSTILFADINGFTEYTSKENPEKVVALLNDFLSKMSEIAIKNNGTVDKFIGDEIMVVFGSPIPQKNHSDLAIKTAKEMIKSAIPILKKYKLSNPGISVGIATGRVISGNVGSDKMSDYTVVGKKVNLASRLTSVAGKNQIFVDEVTKKSSKKYSFKKNSKIKIKSFDDVLVFEVK